MHFISFHNHELDGRFDNIIDYIKDKVSNHFIRLGILRSATNPRLKDLRYMFPQ